MRNLLLSLLFLTLLATTVLGKHSTKLCLKNKENHLFSIFNDLFIPFFNAADKKTFLKIKQTISESEKLAKEILSI